MKNTMVREIRGAKINSKSSFKNQVTQNTRGWKLREQIRYILDAIPTELSRLHRLRKGIYVFSCTEGP